MWSASSTTVTAQCSRLIARRSMRSFSRPGVATTISTVRASEVRLARTLTPPTKTSARSPSAAACGSRFSKTCSASSRVGQSTTPRGFPGRVARGRSPELNRASMGSPKASVFPEPVGALASTSLPSTAEGITLAWMGNASLSPARFRDCASATGSPSDRNSGWEDGGSGSGDGT